MPKAERNDTPLGDELIAQAQESELRPRNEAPSIGNRFMQRLLTRGIALGPQRQRQPEPEKRVEQGGPGDYITG